MPTLIERIQSQTSGNSTLSGVSGLVDQVSHAVELFEKLPNSPGDALTGLLQGLGNVPIPQVQVAAQVGGQIAQVAQHMPTDFSSATSVVEPILSGLGNAVGGDVIPVIQKLVRVIQAVAGLTQFSLSDAATTPAGGGAGAGSGGGSGGGAPSGSGSGGSGAGGSGSGAGGSGSGGASGSGAGSGSGSGGGAPPPPSPDVVAARTRRVQAIANARASLSVFPSPLNAPNAVIFLADITTRIPRDNFKFRKLPVIDDMQQLLSTVIALRGMDDAALKTHVSDSLNAFATFLQGTFTGYLNAYGARLQTLSTHADTAGIQARLNDLRGALGSIATALEGGAAGAMGDLTAAGAALDALEARLELLHDPLRAEAADVTLRTRHLPVDLERQMRQFTALVKPANTFRFLNQLQEPLQSALAQFPPDQIAADLREVLAFPLKIFDAIEATGVQDILAAPTHAIDTLLQQMDTVLGQIASAVSGVFAQVQQALDQFDTQALLDQLHHAFDSLRLAIEAKAQELFKPVSDAIQNAMKELHDAVDGFDPSTVINGLKDFIGNLAGVFDDPDVKSALDAITNGIQQATDAIKTLSFKPVTGAVEQEIDGITSVLKAIDPATLSTEVKLAMTAAAALLPSDLKPVSDPLVAEFGKLVDEGPKPLLAYLADKANVVKNEVEKFSPANLIGDALSAPFKSLTDKLDAFQPLSLLDPVRKALDGFKADLVKQLDPSPALQPLQNAYDALIAQVNKLDPTQIVQPIHDALHEAGEKFIQAIHFDDVINALTGVIDKINAGLSVATEVRQSIQQLADLFNALADSETQLRTWLQSVTNKIGNWSDVSDLTPAMAVISTGVAGAKAAGLAASAAAACDGVRAALEALAPQTGHEDLIALRRRLRPDLIAALPASAEKTALQALSARFDPFSNLYGDGFDALKNLRKALADAHTQLASTLAHWDDRYTRTGGPLAGLEFPSFSASDLKTIFSQALEDEFIVPVGGLFGTLNQAGQAVRAPLQEVVNFLQTFETKAAALLTGDTALGGLRDGLQGLANRIENVNLGFLTDGLNGVFNAVKGKIDILNPQHLADEIKKTISDTLGLLSVDALLTDQAKQDINDAYKGIVDKIKQLDPKQVVEQAVEPVWDEKVKPLIERFDLTALLQALLQKLDDLKGELRGDLDDVDGSYKKMLAAIPKADAAELVGDAVGAIGGALGF